MNYEVSGHVFIVGRNVLTNRSIKCEATTVVYAVPYLHCKITLVLEFISGLCMCIPDIFVCVHAHVDDAHKLDEWQSVTLA